MENYYHWLEEELQGKICDEALRHFLIKMLAKVYRKGYEDGMSFVTTPSEAVL